MGLAGAWAEAHGGEKREKGALGSHPTQPKGVVDLTGFFFEQGPETVPPWVPRLQVLESSRFHLKGSFTAGSTTLLL